MAITLILAPQEYIVGDRPPVRGTLQVSGGNNLYDAGTVLTSTELAFSTLRGIDSTNTLVSNPAASLLPETITSLSISSYTFDFNWPDELPTWERGLLFARAFYKRTDISATLTNNESDSSTSWDLTVSTGSIPTKGKAVVNSEVVDFSRVDSDTITVDRNQYLSGAASHTAGDTITFSTEYESALNSWEIEIDTESRKLFDWDNFVKRLQKPVQGQ